MTRVYDAGGALIAEFRGLQLIRVHGSQGQELADWLHHGAPALRGDQAGDTIMERSIIVRPGDPHFGLALLEAIERRGWRVEEGRA